MTIENKNLLKEDFKNDDKNDDHMIQRMYFFLIPLPKKYFLEGLFINFLLKQNDSQIIKTHQDKFLYGRLLNFEMATVVIFSKIESHLLTVIKQRLKPVFPQ